MFTCESVDTKLDCPPGFPQSFDINFDNAKGVPNDYDDWGNLYPYYPALNYSNGKFQLTPNIKAVYASVPSDAFDGATAPSPSIKGHSLGTVKL